MTQIDLYPKRASRKMNYFDFSAEIRRVAQAESDPIRRASVATLVSRAEFPKAVAKAGWHFLGSGDRVDIESSPHVIVIGVATWDPPELVALDALAHRPVEMGTEIFIFDIDSLEDLASLMPGGKPPRKTPVIAEYRNGHLVLSLQGHEALSEIVKAPPPT